VTITVRHGYVELVRNREKGKIEYQDGERDRRSTEDAKAMFERFKPMLEGGDPPPGVVRYNPHQYHDRRGRHLTHRHRVSRSEFGRWPFRIHPPAKSEASRVVGRRSARAR
jgi:hypothetical protein